MKRKYVKESLDENWVSSDTGLDRYADYGYTHSQEEDSSDVTEMIPPADYKFTEESFAQYIDQIISDILPTQPKLAFETIIQVLIEHPYLKKKPIGFERENPYKKSIDKFLQSFKQITKK